MEPDVFAAFPTPSKDAGVALASIQLIPKGAIVTTGPIHGIAKYSMMLSLNFGKAIAHGMQRVLIGGQDNAIWIEFNDSLHVINGINFFLQIATLASLELLSPWAHGISPWKTLNLCLQFVISHVHDSDS